jgi:phage tail P2-like protein
VDSLLPPSASAQEIALEATVAARFDYLMSLDVGDVKRPEKAPAAFLPWLAWEYSSDEWDSRWSNETKRNSLKDSIMVHQRKGTPWAIRRVLASAGYGNITITSGAGHWANYSIDLERPVTNDQASQIRAILEKTAPKRCELIALTYSEAAFLHDAEINHDGLYNFGAG